MSPSEERAKVLAAEIKKAMRDMKAAEIRIKRLGEELTAVLRQARQEAEAARTIVEYPTGRYECANCGRDTLFTEPTRELPTCDNCGSRQWSGHAPTITTIEAPPPKRFAAGMYECGKCASRTAVAVECDELSPCELCGAAELMPLST